MAEAAPITNYATLQTAVARWLRRDYSQAGGTVSDEVVEEIPNAIRLAEADMFPQLRLWQMIRVIWGMPQLVDGYVDMPEDYLQPRYIAVKSAGGATGRTLSKIDVVNSSVWLDGVGVGGGYPKMGIIRGHRLYMWPLPSEGQWIELDYYASPQPLGEVAGVGLVESNEVLFHYPNLYLFGALTFAGEFDENPRADRWRSAYQDMLAKVNVQSVAAGIGPAPRGRMPR